MSTLFPTTIDTFNNPTETSNLNSVGVEHNLQHSDANDAIEALEAKIGINSSADVNSIDYKIRQLQPMLLYTGAPASASSAGTTGTIIVEGGYMYICVATNTWVRSTVASW